MLFLLSKKSVGPCLAKTFVITTARIEKYFERNFAATILST